MSDPDLMSSFKAAPIPKILCSSETGEPITNCMMCEKYLLNDGTPYMIEKAFKQHASLNLKEVIFEYAMCMDCAFKMNEALSQESRQRIAAYFQERTNISARAKTLLENKSQDIDPWIENCIVKNSAIEKSPEYQLVAHCNGGNIIYAATPFAISTEALEEITSLMSAQSLGEMDDFIGKYFSGPPEVAALLRKKFLLV